MGNSALAILPASATKWTVISGTMTGSVRLMNVPTFVVGRSPECEIVIVNDPKCSRKHAQIESTGYGCDVISLNEKNPVLVNGREIERASLSDGDIVTFGETQVQYNVTSAQSGAGEPRHHMAIVPPSPSDMAVRQTSVPHGAGHGDAFAVPRSASRPRSRGQSRKQGNRTRFYIIVAVVGLFMWLLLSPSTAKKKANDIRNEQQIQADIDAANKLRDAAEMENNKKVDQSVTARQAQENYVRGFRDYRKGQFERALISFQACLALNPDHVLCNRYLRLSQRKFDELVQYQMVLGRKYRDQNQYAACRASFRNAMVMVKDANSKVFQEAKANYDACDALAEGRF